MRTPLMAKLFPFFYSLFGDRVYNARVLVHDAMKEVCLRESQAAYHRTMRDYHDSEAAGIDPHQDWNRFAEVKESWQHEKTDLVVILRRLDISRAKLRARREQLAKLEDQELLRQLKEPADDHHPDA